MKNWRNSDSVLVSVVIPAFNEEKTVGGVVERASRVLKESGLPFEVTVVDDGSSDDTAVVAEGFGAKVIRNNHRLGKGVALRRGFSVCRGNVVVTLDADGSHQPEEIPSLLKPILNGGFDAVFGYRFHNPTSPPLTEFRFMGNRLFDCFIYLFTRKRIVDSQCGFRAFSTRIVKSMKLSSRWFEIESEMLIKVIEGNYRFIEVPVTFAIASRPSNLNSFRDGLIILLKILSKCFK
jgi:glycosyltransferase involved in cell wall biosynthesis